MKRLRINNNEEKYRRLIETTSEGYWRISLQFETLDVNQALTEIWGMNERKCWESRYLILWTMKTSGY